jgi:hypothetical protein
MKGDYVSISLPKDLHAKLALFIESPENNASLHPFSSKVGVIRAALEAFYKEHAPNSMVDA